MKWSVRAVGAALALTAVAATPAAAAPKLRSYEVTVHRSTLEKLATAGFDVTEGRQGREVTIVATRGQARDLEKDGIEADPVSVQRVIDDYGDADGYDVWRPYARPAFDADGNETDNLVGEMRALAADHPGIVKLERIGTTAGGPQDPEHPDADGDYSEPKPIYAVKVSRDARSEPDGSKPAVLYSSTQHAREWLSTETNRRIMRLLVDNYGSTGTAVGTDGAPVAGVDAAELTQLVNQRELWFVLVANPDGYDYTFEDEDTRLWRKNLRDNNGDGQLTVGDGVDPNRNFPTHWGYDNEGSGVIPADETYRGPGPASEPETKALDGLSRRVNFEWNDNFHTYGPLLLYPFGWQLDTFAADDPIFRAIAGSDENPAVESYNPDVGGEYNPGVGAELYTTNGDTNDHLYSAYGTLSFTPELDGGDPDAEPGEETGGFIFQDVEADVQAVFESQIQFSLDMARSAADPANPVSHLGNTAPDFELDSFDVSFGDPQTVQVSAKRELGPVTLHWQVGGDDEQTAPTSEWKGGERYGDEGDVYYHRMRGTVTGTEAGDHVKAWFTADGERSKAFTYRVESDSDKPVLVIAAENYSGPVPAYPDPTKPAYLGPHAAALDALGVKYDVWDVDARDQRAPDPLGVLSHYKGVVWYTGDDVVTRDPGQPGGSGALRVANQLTVNVRDFLNEGGKLLYAGNDSGLQNFQAYSYAQFGEPTDNPQGYCDAPGTGCIPLSNDFFQYYLGGYILVDDSGYGPDPAQEKPFDVFGVGPLAGFRAGLNASDLTAPNSVVTTSSILDPAQFPQFRSESLLDYDRPGAAPYDPFTGDWYLFSGAGDSAYRRLTKTVDLTGKTGGELDFQISFDTEANYDHAFVEAHTVGDDDWTTLPLLGDDGEEVSSDDPGSSCSGDDYTWVDIHPFLEHYVTVLDEGLPYDPDDPANGGCLNTGTTGEWHSVTGNSAGWNHLTADLSAFDGKQVEVSISYAQDGASAGLGVFLDDLRTSAGGQELSSTSFETDLGGWTVADPPAESPPLPDTWKRSQSAIDETPGVATEDSVWLTFGLETVDTDANRTELVRKALVRLGLLTEPEPTPSPSPSPTATPTVTPEPTATPDPEPAKGRLVLKGGPRRADGRKVPLRFKCKDFGSDTCRGTVRLRRKGKVVGKERFTVDTDRFATVRVKLSKALSRKLVRRGELRMTFAVSARGGGRSYGASEAITVRAPKR